VIAPANGAVSPLEAAVARFVAGPEAGAPGTLLREGDDFTLAVRVLPRNRGLLPPFLSRPAFLAYYSSRDGDLRLEEAFSLLRPFLAEAGIPKAAGRWFLLSNRGGIYLHETVTAEETWRSESRRAGNSWRLCVINPENGTACLSPGHRLNRVFSERFKFLIEQYRLTPKDVWERETDEAVALCLEALGG